jgi:hypothetical protein
VHALLYACGFSKSLPLLPFPRSQPPLASLHNDKDVVYPQGHSLLYPLAPVISCGTHWLNHPATFSTWSSSRISLLALPCPSCALLTCHIRWTLSPLDHSPMKQGIRNTIPAIGHTNMACLLGSGEFFFCFGANRAGGIIESSLPVTSEKRIQVTFLNIQILGTNMCKRLLHGSTLSTLLP